MAALAWREGSRLLPAREQGSQGVVAESGRDDEPRRGGATPHVLAPARPSSLGIDAHRRLVEQDDVGVVLDACGKVEASLHPPEKASIRSSAHSEKPERAEAAEQASLRAFFARPESAP